MSHDDAGSAATLRQMMQSTSNLLLARWILKNLDWSGGNSDENGEFVASILEEHARQVRSALRPTPPTAKPEWSNGNRCDTCGAWCIDNCQSCGAPQCCPQCCRISSLEAARSVPVQNDIAARPMTVAYLGRRMGVRGGIDHQTLAWTPDELREKGYHDLEIVALLWGGAPQSETPAMPTGKVLVPWEPTSEMLNRGADAWRTVHENPSSLQGQALRVYLAMIAAAPSPSGVEERYPDGGRAKVPDVWPTQAMSERGLAVMRQSPMSEGGVNSVFLAMLAAAPSPSVNEERK